MNNEVLLTVKHDLQKVLDALQLIEDKNKLVGKSFEDNSKKVGDTVGDNTKKVGGLLNNMRDLARRSFDQMKQDMQSLLGLQALKGGLKLSSQFEGTVKEVFNLSDAVRRLGGSFGVSESRFAKFQGALSRGFGDIGASSEEAAAALQGLTGKGLKGEGNVLEYAKTAAQLGMLSGERGQAGNIAGSMAGVVRAQGKDVNDVKAMQALAREVTAVSKSTGQGASEVLKNMQDVFEQMPDDLRKSMSTQGIGQIGVASAIGGPQAASALKSILSKSKEERAVFESTGLSKIFGKDGQIDLKGLKDVAKDLKSKGISSRMAARTLGLEGDQAEGLVRLIEKSDQLSEALEQTKNASRDYAKEARKSLGFGEAFKANIRKVQGMFGEQIGGLTQGATDLLSSASESTGGAAAVTVGGGVLAALLAGGGLRSVGKGLGVGGLAKATASEALTGRTVQDVRVINFSEMNDASSAGGLAGKALEKVGGAKGLLGMAGSAAKLVGPLAVAYGAGKAAENISWKNSQGFEGNAFEQLFFRLDQLFGSDRFKQMQKAQEVSVNIKTQVPELKASVQKTRGASN